MGGSNQKPIGYIYYIVIYVSNSYRFFAIILLTFRNKNAIRFLGTIFMDKSRMKKSILIVVLAIILYGLL